MKLLTNLLACVCVCVFYKGYTHSDKLYIIVKLLKKAVAIPHVFLKFNIKN